MKILIIGGTGFIGYHLATKCLKLRWKVTSISLKKPRKKRKLKSVIYRLCDISHKKKLRNIVKNKKYNYVVNLGGYVDHINKKRTYKSHVVGSRNLFQVLKNKKIKSFIQIGSSNEYGNLKSPHYESRIGKPKTIYGKSKYLASNYLLECYKKYKFPVTVLRFYQLFGPGQDMNRFLPQLIHSCLKKIVFFTSSGMQSRDFLYIDDAIEAITRSIKAKESKGKIFNIGSGKAIKLKKIMEIVEKRLNYFYPVYGKVTLRKDEPNIIYPNTNLAKKILKWKNKTSFSKGLDKTINYYKKSFNKERAF